MTLLWTRVLLRNLTKRNFHTTKITSLFFESDDKEGYKKKTELEKDWEKWKLMDKIKLELSFFKECCKDALNQLKTNFNDGPKFAIPENHVEVFTRFTGKEGELDKWVVTCDSDHKEGYSTAKLEYTRHNKGLFHGFLDTKVPVDGIIKRTGYANLKMTPKLTPFKRNSAYDWDPFTHVVFRIRGDGRVYLVNLHVNATFDVCWYDLYHYFIWTRGGPYWQYVRIPFSKFVFAYKGRVQATHTSPPRDHINAVSFTVADKITGPFKLEIDYIGVEYDPHHDEESAYETHTFPDHYFW